jgi:23S rRNA pseudouridine1911/1915/1917 synthase
MIERQALHAKSLTFTHPVSGQTLSITSDLPDDMAQLITALRENSH